MQFLEVKGLGRQEDGAWIVEDARFTQPKGQRLAVAGATGSGKSTLLQMIAGLVQPHAGAAFFKGAQIKGPDERLLPGHPGIAYLSQSFELRNHYRVEELLQYANKLDPAAAQKLYTLCRIDHLMQRKNVQVSGGERQRIALARLLTGAPELLLLDEPFSNLDLLHKNILKEVLEAVQQEMATTVMLVSHDPQDILSWADALLVLQDGKIVQVGNPLDVYYNPLNEYVAGLLGPYNLLSGAAWQELTGNTAPTIARPDGLVLNLSGKGVAGEVAGVHFYGSHTLVEVQCDDVRVLVNTHKKNLQPGVQVFLSVRR